MEGIWDIKVDANHDGDGLRDVSPSKVRVDDKGYKYYLFSKKVFTNHKYSIPDDDFELFREFLEDRIHIYPSDGNIPCNVVASEASEVLDHIVAYSKDTNNPYFESAKTAMKKGKLALLRGTVKLYLGKYTTKDWRRKRLTNKINFWTFQVSLLDHILEHLGWIKNYETSEWEKILQWTNLVSGEKRFEERCTADNLNQLLDFTSENYFEGTRLKNIFNKKLRRGLDVDISDIINVVLFSNNLAGENSDEWDEAWGSFESTTNTRNARITSNIISLCRYSLGTVDYLERISNAINSYYKKILDKNEYSDENLKKICRMLIHWMKYLAENGPQNTRNMIHEFLLEQKDKKQNHAKNLRKFTDKVLKLLNSKYEYLKIRFEVDGMTD